MSKVKSLDIGSRDLGTRLISDKEMKWIPCASSPEAVVAIRGWGCSPGSAQRRH